MARTWNELTAAEIVSIGELDAIANNSVIYKDNSGVYQRVALGTNGQFLKSTGTTGAPEFTTVAGGGDVTKVGTPVDDQVGVWTGDGTIEGTTGLTYDGSNFQLTGDIGSTGTRITKGWFVALTVTNAIVASITGNAATVTTITGLAPDTATTQATQAAITTCVNLVTTGALASGSIASGFGTINIGTSNAVSCGSVELGHASDTTLSRSAAGVLAVEGVVIPSISSTNALTNKELTARVVTTASDATAVIDVAVTDVYQLTAMAAATTFSFTGAPTDGKKIMIRFKDDGTTRALTWTGFTVIGTTLPTTTTVSKRHYVGVEYNAAASAYHVIATQEEA